MRHCSVKVRGCTYSGTGLSFGYVSLVVRKTSAHTSRTGSHDKRDLLIRHVRSSYPNKPAPPSQDEAYYIVVSRLLFPKWHGTFEVASYEYAF